MYIIMIITAVCGAALIIFSIINKIRHGGSCCGEHEATADKIRVADHDLSHYPYHYTAEIEGMICIHCVRNVENAFHKFEGIYDARFISRITSIGLTPGCHVQIIKNDKNRPVLLYSRDTMIAVNRRECTGITVTEVRK